MSRVEQNKKSGSLGGIQAAANMTKEQRQDRAGKGGQECRERYGSDFYRNIRQIGINKAKKNK